MARISSDFAANNQYLVVERARRHKKGRKGRKLLKTGQNRAKISEKRAKTLKKGAFKRLTNFLPFNIIVKRVRKNVYMGRSVKLLQTSVQTRGGR